MSASCQSLLPHLAEMAEMGVTAVRVSPQSEHTRQIVEAFASEIAGNACSPEQLAQLKQAAGGDWVDGYWRGQAGIVNQGESQDACA